MEINLIEYRNNWCTHVYSVQGKQVNPTKVCVYENGRAVGEFRVACSEESGSYNDMGRHYDYKTRQYHVVVASPFGNINGPSLNELIRKGYLIELLES